MITKEILNVVNDNHFVSSELMRKPAPNTKSQNRLSYYTEILFDIENINVNLIAKVDTGASYTLIGLDADGLDACTDYIKEYAVEEIEKPEDATKNLITMKSLIVSNFQLTKDIIIPKIKVYFSEDLRDKVILGMDILGLFDFYYKHEVKQLTGTFWLIHNCYTDFKMEKQIKEKGYVQPRTIMSVDNNVRVEDRVLHKTKYGYYIEVNNQKVSVKPNEIHQDNKGYYTIYNNIRYNLDMKHII